MAARVSLAPDLERLIAERIAAPHVRRLADVAERNAATFAPPVKVWHTQGDDRVRPWHKGANGQAVPDNLRFAVPHSPRVGHQAHHGEVEMLRQPRDPTAYYLQTQACRCYTSNTDALARSIHAGPLTVSGSRASVTVATRYPRAIESEFGTAEDQPARFMRRALQTSRLT